MQMNTICACSNPVYNKQLLPPFYGYYTGQPALPGTHSEEVKDFVGAEFSCLHALTDGN